MFRIRTDVIFPRYTSFKIGGTTTGGGEIVLYEKYPGTNAVTVKAPDNITTNFTLILPDDDGMLNEFLQTDGNGNLNWAVPSGAGDVVGPAGVAEDKTVAIYNGVGGKTIQDSLVLIDDVTLTIKGNPTIPANEPSIRIRESFVNGTNYIEFKSPTSMTANRTFIFPDSVGGGTGEVLQTDGTGVLSWIDHGGLAGKGDDDHTQYAMLMGRMGGQILNGGTAAGNGLSIQANSADATGTIVLNTNVNISDDLNVGIINVGTGGAVKTVNMGSTTGGSTTKIQSGTGGIDISNDVISTTVNVGTGGAVKTVNMGSTTGGSTTKIQSGTGNVNINTTTITPSGTFTLPRSDLGGKIVFTRSGLGGNTTTIQSGVQAIDLTYTLPTLASTGTQFLKSNGVGVLSWESVGDVVGPAGIVEDKTIAIYNGVTGKIIQDSLALIDNQIFTMKGTNVDSASIRLREDTDNGTNYVGIKAPTSVTTDRTFILPDSSGTQGQVMMTDGNNPATLYWSVPMSSRTYFIRAGTNTVGTYGIGNYRYVRWNVYSADTVNLGAGNFDAAFTNFYPPIKGIWSIHVNIIYASGVGPSHSDEAFISTIRNNNALNYSATGNPATLAYTTLPASMSAIIYANGTTDYICAGFYNGGGGSSNLQSTLRNSFHAVLIHEIL